MPTMTLTSRKALTDERSVAMGYGPVCAERFGLDWGTIPDDVRRAAEALAK